jgi:hypothetical protein
MIGWETRALKSVRNVANGVPYVSNLNAVRVWVAADARRAGAGWVAAGALHARLACGVSAW